MLTRHATPQEYANVNGTSPPTIRRNKGNTRPPQPAYWKHEIRGLICANCQARWATEAHHILRVQTLRRNAKSHDYTFAAVLWDRRNRLPLCTTCHGRHHNRQQPISQTILRRFASHVWDFAGELGLNTAIDREYPQGADCTPPHAETRGVQLAAQAPAASSRRQQEGGAYGPP